VFQSIHSFRADAALSTWIYRIAVTKCMDELKKRNRKKRISSIGKILHLDEVAELLIGSHRTDQNVVQKEQMSHIMKSLNKLPDNQRVAFTLSKIEGYSNKEIAEIMNTNTTQVESLIHRGKQKVTASLETILKNNLQMSELLKKIF
jgi:RNA polymerase sigma-70 factor (ECF subfamily)